MKISVVLLALLFVCCRAAGQQDFAGQAGVAPFADSIVSSGDHLSASPAGIPGKINIPDYLFLISRDFKTALTKPFHMGATDWVIAGKFSLIAVATGFADEPIQRAASRLLSGHPRRQAISRQVTNFGAQYETCILAGLGAYSLLFKNQRLKNTVIIASQAYVTGVVFGKAMKFLTNRDRPFTDSLQVDIEPTFHGPFYRSPAAGPKRTNSSFPSGHTTAAFAAAAAFAMQYHDKPLMPILAYSVAGLVGLSRLSENKHWATDVLAGAALGYLSGRLAVNIFRDFTGSQPAQSRKSPLQFDLGYKHGSVTAGLFYAL